MELVYIIFLFLAVGKSAYADFLFESEEGDENSFSKRMLNSKESSTKEGTFMAMVKSAEYNTLCTAILISNRLLISRVRFFSQYQGTKMEAMTGFYRRPGQIYEIEKVHIHPNFTSLENYHDIALIELKEEIKENNHEKPIPLLTDNDLIRQGNMLMKMFGYGISKLSNLPAHSFGILTSKSAFVNTDVLDLKASILVLGTSADLSYGDAGAPLILDGKLAGVATYTVACKEGFPGIFTGILNHYDWIALEMGKADLKYISRNNLP